MLLEKGAGVGAALLEWGMCASSGHGDDLRRE
jgi:hypothetical protein